MDTSDTKTRIISAQLMPNGAFEVVRFIPSNIAYGNGQVCPGEVTKEIYVVGADGNIMLHEKVVGKHQPARLVAETFEFPKSGSQ